jgi:hypothetical protein
MWSRMTDSWLGALTGSVRQTPDIFPFATAPYCSHIVRTLFAYRARACSSRSRRSRSRCNAEYWSYYGADDEKILAAMPEMSHFRSPDNVVGFSAVASERLPPLQWCPALLVLYVVLNRELEPALRPAEGSSMHGRPSGSQAKLAGPTHRVGGGRVGGGPAHVVGINKVAVSRARPHEPPREGDGRSPPSGPPWSGHKPRVGPESRMPVGASVLEVKKQEVKQ